MINSIDFKFKSIMIYSNTHLDREKDGFKVCYYEKIFITTKFLSEELGFRAKITSLVY